MALGGNGVCRVWWVGGLGHQADSLGYMQGQWASEGWDHVPSVLNFRASPSGAQCLLNEWHTEKSTVPGLAPACFESPEQNMTSLENQLPGYRPRGIFSLSEDKVQKASFCSRPPHHTGLRTEFARTHGKPLEAPGSDCLGANVCQGEGRPRILRKWRLSSGTPPLKAIFGDCLLLPTQPGLHLAGGQRLPGHACSC